MKNKVLVLIGLCIFLFAFTAKEKALFEIPRNWPKPYYNFSKNKLTTEKILLGRVLFYDPILSRNNTVSCANCHSPYNAFTHVDHALSHGIDDRVGTRNSPALMNLAWHPSFMWDGAINHLDMQALAPISSHTEMDESFANAVNKLQQQSKYKNLFYRAFTDSTVRGENTLKALSQFMLTLVCANTKYDKVMRKEDSFTVQENNGYLLFKQHCAACHTEPLFTNLQFENNGLPIDTTLNDLGRMRISKQTKDSCKFKVPTLRNIEFSFPYMHDGRFKRLQEVLNHYTQGIHQTSTLSKPLQKPILLSANQKVDLIAFLLTLSDKSFLFNPAFAYPKEVLNK